MIPLGTRGSRVCIFESDLHSAYKIYGIDSYRSSTEEPANYPESNGRLGLKTLVGSKLGGPKGLHIKRRINWTQ